uniref:Uncharacterized protein n=1 Tax=Aegilops tauschii subsp. strangulata TaxID=200361 RepID=A0A453DB76_AEGTS
MAGRKETALDLAKFVDKGVQVKLTGGRQGLIGTAETPLFLLSLCYDTLSDPLEAPPICLR